MTHAACTDLISAIKTPEIMASFSLKQWDAVTRYARAAGLLGRLAVLARRHQVDTTLPRAVWHALEGGLVYAERQAVAIRNELTKLDQALAGLGVPVLVLKGAAYIASDSPAAAGRLMSDVDILVQKRHVPGAEAALMLAGWNTGHHDDYDQRYYRQWMHEIPPMRHIRRGTVIDLHHNLLPETARIKTRPDLIIAAAHPLPGMRCLHVPDPLDLILHSATHLMHEGDWGHGLRDLTDLYALITAASAHDEFWTTLTVRAQTLNLERPLYYALVQLERIFGLQVQIDSLNRPPWPIGQTTNVLLGRGISSFHTECRRSFSEFAEFILYVRSHWLRMPLHLLLPHLAHKAFAKEPEAEKAI